MKKNPLFKNTEELISMILGLVIVLLMGGLIFNYFQKKGGKVDVPGVSNDIKLDSSPIEEEKAISPTSKEEKVIISTGEKEYKVTIGDNLWKIAASEYGSGYNWVDIAKRNNLVNPNQLVVGQNIILPKAEKRVVENNQKIANAIEGNEYTTNKGDSLSKIALRAYGDRYAWTRIWEANKGQIKNANLIYPGMKLSIPRDTSSNTTESGKTTQNQEK